MQIVITYHTKVRMVDRGITEKQILETLEPPTTVKRGKDVKLIAIKNGIRVVYVVEGDILTVVTVTHT